MAIDKSKVMDYTKKLLMSKMRILASHGFYGLLLGHAKLSLDESCPTAYTDGRKIAFNPSFLERLNEDEVDFVLMHEILHIVLQHCMRYDKRNPETFNIACDIVVNSNILKSNGNIKRKISIDGSPLMHIAPNGKEGHLYTAEEVYEMLKDSNNTSNGGSESGDGSENEGEGVGSHKNDDDNGKNGNGKNGNNKNIKNNNGRYYVFDDHSYWDDKEDKELSDAWEKYFDDACKIVSIEDPSNSRGTIPAFAERILKERKKAQTNWRSVLDNFVQEDINDYSFNPPDRRFSDYDFMLPDFNEKDESIKNVLFMIDTSGSMSDNMITQAYDEIRGAIEQFGGKLEGYLGFFDAVVVEPKPFSSIDELEIIRPYGGGGTRFDIIFKYVKSKMNNPYPSSIVILTDGYAPFPEKELAMDIPVLWVINNDDVVPPWGRHTTIYIE